MTKSFCIGVDVGGTKISAVAVDACGIILTQKKCPTPQDAAPGPIYQQIRDLIHDVVTEKEVRGRKLLGIGLGIPGIVRSNQKDILITPNIRLSGFPLARKLTQSFKVKTVLQNDVNLGLLAEKWFGSARGARNVIGIFPGTGVGGAIIINGQLYMGADGAAAELGHMILDRDSKHVNAGVYGSLEALASRRAIERNIRAAVKGKKGTAIQNLNGGNLRQIKSSVIAESLRRRDPAVTRVLNNACRVLGEACISLRHILNPEMIVLGGGVIEACGDYMMPRIQNISAKDPFFAGVDRCAIVRSQLGDDAVLLGAVVCILQALQKKIPAQISFYPKIVMRNSKTVIINRKVYREDIYVRADGKVKKIKDKGSWNGLRRQNTIGAQELSRLCKKNPEIFIIGATGKRPAITREGKHFLTKEDIEYKILPQKAAIEFYNSLHRRKAILIR